jgi:hypothetical protein|tara:strand:- start:592 stop:810 length:219 start_codon:yes stop_codon:yes gene_type:complete
MNKDNTLCQDTLEKIKGIIAEQITFLENEKICEYDPRTSFMPLLPLSKWGRSISEQEAKIQSLKEILILLDK